MFLIMRRPPSYSDSFIVLSPRHKVNYEEDFLDSVEPAAEEPEEESYAQCGLLFIFKGSLHIFCISVFETTFYFLYINRSEDAGIFNTINTYYSPLINDCETTWTNGTRWLVQELLTYSINKTLVDAQGTDAYAVRSAYNATLIVQSSMYSLASCILCVGIVFICICNKWKVSWTRIFLENMLFIAVLAAYEFFFYNTIIYKYTTLSTSELNKYIIDGLASCAMPSK